MTDIQAGLTVYYDGLDSAEEPTEQDGATQCRLNSLTA